MKAFALCTVAAAVALTAVLPAGAAAPRGGRSNPIPLNSWTRSPIEGWTIKVTDPVPYAWPQIRRENSLNDPPPAGRTFFMARVTAIYRRSGRSTFSDAGRTYAVGRSNVEYDEFLDDCGVLPDDMTLEGDRRVFRGGRISGNVCWSVKKSDVSTLLMYRTYNLFDVEGLESEVYWKLRR